MNVNNFAISDVFFYIHVEIDGIVLFSDKGRHSSWTLIIIGVVIQFFHMHAHEMTVKIHLSLFICGEKR